MTRIFISYRRDDSGMAAGRIYDHLVGKFGDHALFMDVASIDGGDDFVEVIERAVSACDVLVAVIGARWLTIADKKGKRRLDNPNDFVRIEVSTALKRGIRVIPVLIDGMEMMSPDDLPDDLRALTRKNAVSLNTDQFRADIQKLITAVEKTLAKPADPPAAQSNADFLSGFFATHPADSQDMGEVGRRVGDLLKAQGIPLELPTLKYLVEVVEGLDAKPLFAQGTPLPTERSYSPKLKLGATLLGLRAVSVKAAGKVIGTLQAINSTALPDELTARVSADHVLTFTGQNAQSYFTFDLKTLD